MKSKLKASNETAGHRQGTILTNKPALDTCMTTPVVIHSTPMSHQSDSFFNQSYRSHATPEQSSTMRGLLELEGSISSSLLTPEGSFGSDTVIDMDGTVTIDESHTNTETHVQLETVSFNTNVNVNTLQVRNVMSI